MVKPFPYLAVCIYLAAASAAFAQSSYVFQLPGVAQSGRPPQIIGLGDNDFVRKLGPATNPGFAGATRMLATPNGAKFYIVGTGGTLSATSALGAVTPIPAAIAGAVNDITVTPDGKYLLVAADHFYVINTTTDSLQVDADTGIPNGATPVGVAVSHDAKTAWILTNSTTGSTVTALDLASFQTSPTQLSLLSGTTSMTLSPRGLLYVSTKANRILEIDPVTMSITNLGQITVPGQAGPLQFTPDGNTAYFVNLNVCATCSPVFQLNVQSHSISTWVPQDGSFPPTIDQVLVAGNSRIFGISLANTTLYDITPAPLAVAPSALSATAAALPVSSVFAAAVSNEVPSARYIYLLFTDHNFYRVNLGNNGVEQTATLDPIDGVVLQFVPVPAQSGAASLTPVNVSQGVTPGGTTVLIAQVLDAVGRPVYGAPVTFSAADPTAGISITNPSVTTTAGGWAQATVTAPATTGNFTVVASSGTLSANFVLNVSGTGGSGGGSGNSQMTIYAGDGQLLAQTGTTTLPLTVKLTDASGNPVPNAQVLFAVTEGIGSVIALNQSVTDAAGLARANFTSGSLPTGTRVLLSKVTATSAVGTVEFYEITQDALLNNVQSPNSFIIVPSGVRKVSVPQGGVLPAGIKVQTFAENTGQPIPNVGLRLADPANLSAPSPIASCKGLSRGDNNGISTCDVVAACQLDAILPHDYGVFLSVGEYQQFSITVTVTPGTPSLFTPISPLNQSGAAGNSLSLLARVTDGCGQPVSVSGLSWGLLQGSAPATLSKTQSSSDAGGNVSATVTLGQTAGVVQVQLSGPGVTPIIFNITNQVSVSGISLVSGGGQSVLVGQPFAQPVIFFVHDAGNHPVQGASVTFSVSGSASISSLATVTTDAQGRAQVTVTAGSTPGNIVVTATSGTSSATATLSSHAAGPTITSSSFTNAASGAVGMAPCGFVTVTGTGVAPTVQGVLSAVTFFGAYPYSLGGLSITVNNVPVPIQAVANDQFGQRANFQAPCELTGTSATVVVTANGATTIVNNVPVASVQPGIFTFTGSNNKVYGAVIREADGTYVTSANPARQGEKVYVVATGLGQATPTLITNSAGTGSQNVILPTAVFLNGRGIPGLSARYLFGWVGAYLVEFQIPADAATGVDQNLLVVETSTDGNTFLGVSNTVLMPAVSASGTGGGGTGTGGGGTSGGGTGTGGGGTGTGGGGTGTGGGGTGTGGGGTGTGGGGTGTSGATAPTQDEINSWIARGNYVSGQLSLTRSTAFTTTDSFTGGAPTTSTTKTDSFSGQFTKTSGADLSKLLNNQLPAGFPVLSPTVGSCSVYSITSLTNPFPNLTTVNLDAGAQLTSNGPNGTQFALRQNTQGVGFTYSASNVPNTYLAAGRYALSGPGGADVGLFSGNLDTVADLVVTNTDNFKLINRSGGITVNWTGGEQSNILVISGSSFSLNLQTQAINGSAFVCIQNVSAGQFTVPASILTQLPASPVTTAGGVSIITRGTFSVTASGKGARFTAPSGVDILTANNSWVWTFTPQYQ